MDNLCASQAEAIAFLSDPNSFTPSVSNVTRIDTHAAIIFLAGQYAYKIKRAVRYTYLDFSTLEKRHKVCLHEFKRNKTAAPGIYIEVVPLVRTPNGVIAFEELGEPIEWVVRMLRFDQSFLFDQMAEKSALDVDHIASLARVIAQYHSRASRVPSFDFDGKLTEVITSTVTSLAEASGALGLDVVRSYASAIVRTQNDARKVLRARTDQGYVRVCHGDLHLQNIVLFDGQPTLFDAIEFDDEIATIDVLFDLAFVLMDLWRRGLKSHANMLFNGYMNHYDIEEDFDGLALLPLFLGLRAAIRAMVTLDRLKHVDTLALRYEAKLEANRYVRLACELLAPEEPRLVAIGGLSGTGKTTVAAGIAPLVGRPPGAIHLRTDIERKRLFSVGFGRKLRPDAYTREVSRKIYRQICDKAGQALRAGHSVVLDAVFLEPEQRELIEQTAFAAGAGFSGVWLEAEEGRLIERVESREGDASDADAVVVRKQLSTDPGDVSWYTVRADGTRENTERSVSQFLNLQHFTLKRLS